MTPFRPPTQPLQHLSLLGGNLFDKPLHPFGLGAISIHIPSFRCTVTSFPFHNIIFLLRVLYPPLSSRLLAYSQLCSLAYALFTRPVVLGARVAWWCGGFVKETWFPNGEEITFNPHSLMCTLKTYGWTPQRETCITSQSLRYPTRHRAHVQGVDCRGCFKATRERRTATCSRPLTCCSPAVSLSRGIKLSLNFLHPLGNPYVGKDVCIPEEQTQRMVLPLPCFGCVCPNIEQE